MRHLTLAALLAASPAAAQIELRFTEGAPTDRFEIRNVGGCAIGPFGVTIDLAGSPAGLVFDAAPGGAGVEVFQPLVVVAGEGRLAAPPALADGDTSVTLELTGLGAGEAVAFTADIDDTGGGREITVSGSEIAGARATAGTGTGTFAADARARLPAPDCLS